MVRNRAKSRAGRDQEMVQLRPLVTSLVAFKELHDREQHRQDAELAGGMVSGARLFLGQSSRRY